MGNLLLITEIVLLVLAIVAIICHVIARKKLETGIAISVITSTLLGVQIVNLIIAISDGGNYKEELLHFFFILAVVIGSTILSYADIKDQEKESSSVSVVEVHIGIPKEKTEEVDEKND